MGRFMESGHVRGADALDAMNPYCVMRALLPASHYYFVAGKSARLTIYGGTVHGKRLPPHFSETELLLLGLLIEWHIQSTPTEFTRFLD